MKIHEYQAKDIFRRYGVPLPAGAVAETVDEAVERARALSRYPVVVKAQVHVGGRGKAGGVKLARNLDEVAAAARAILGMSIKGITVRKVLVEEGVDIEREIYAGIVVDRARKCPVIMVSSSGGVDIEEVAASNPERILHLPIQPGLGLRDFQVRQANFFLGIPKDAQATLGLMLSTMERVMMELDASLVEINPLALNEAGHLIACDAKMNFDDNALDLHPDAAALRDDNEEDPIEVEAHKHHVNYVKLDGTIGCLVNGAGLAMGTMDMVKAFGGRPANFLDVGGAANAETVAEALRIVTSDPAVNTILFNIFGGIVRCDRVAEGILKAREKVGIDMPIVVRLVGTNEEKARDLLAETDLVMMPTMAEAARKAVELSQLGEK